MKYVLGFLFNVKLTRVVLIRKQRPSWQRGLLNGIGGKIEHGETPEEAMVREFQEETGVTVKEWIGFTKMTGPHKSDPDSWEVSCFYAFAGDKFFATIKTTTDEEVVILHPSLIYRGCPDSIHSNLAWLIPLAIDFSGIDYKIQIPEAI